MSASQANNSRANNSNSQQQHNEFSRLFDIHNNNSTRSSSNEKGAMQRLCSSGLALLLLVACAATAAAYSPTKDSRSGQLSPSILLMGEFDWALSTGRDGKAWSRCLDMVWRARSLSKGNRINFVPTHHWLPRDDGFGVSQYCYLHTTGGSDRGTCLTWTPGKMAEFKKSMTYCFAEAFRQGFTPYVRPHLDDGLNRCVCVCACVVYIKTSLLIWCRLL